jgi:hypothetical protein
VIFATANDLSQLVSSVCRELKVHFVLCGMFDSDTPVVFESFDQHRDMQQYLVLEPERQLKVRQVTQKDGSIKFAVDQLANPKSVAVSCGGFASEKLLVAGQIGYSSNDPDAADMFFAFDQEVRKKFSKIKAYWVGPEAERLLDSGVNLAATARGSSEYYLKR